MRILQGFSAGGEWGGAALMAVEHAPRDRRGFWGAYPQIGVPVGMIIATLVLFLLRLSMSEEQFLEWGWRSRSCLQPSFSSATTPPATS